MFFFILGIFYIIIVGNKTNPDDVGYETFLILTPISLLAFILHVRYFIKSHKELKKILRIFFVLRFFIKIMISLWFSKI